MLSVGGVIWDILFKAIWGRNDYDFLCAEKLDK